MTDTHSTVSFDTLKFVKYLVAAGVPREQADAEAEALNEALSQLATKKDLKDAIERLKTDLTREIDSLRSDMQSELRAIRADMERDNNAIRADMERDNNAIRADMGDENNAIRADMNAIRADMNALEYRLTIKLGAMLALAVGLTVTLLKLVP